MSSEVEILRRVLTISRVSAKMAAEAAARALILPAP